MDTVGTPGLREPLERIARQNGGRLVERAVNGRSTMAQRVVIHARQIVVDQRIDVDRLDRGRHADRRRAIDRMHFGKPTGLRPFDDADGR